MRILLVTLNHQARSSDSLADQALELAALGNDVCVFAVGNAESDVRSDGRDLGFGNLRVLAPRGGSRRHRATLLFSALAAAAIRHPIQLWRLVRAARRRRDARSGLLGTLSVSVPILAHRADIVHFDWIDAPKMCIDVLPLLDMPIVVSCTGSDLRINPLSSESYHEPIREVLERADLVQCVSEDLRGRALKFGLDPSKAYVSQRGVDTTFFCPAPGPSGDAMSPRVEARSRELRVVSVGHLHWVKGYEYALLALRDVWRAGVEISYEILGKEAGALLSVRTAIRDLGLEEHVIVRGECSRTEVRESLRLADVFVLASLSEGVSNAALEAMAVGVPVVVTDVGGMADAVTDGVNGLLVPSRDPAALANALLELAADPERRRQMGERGRARAIADFDVKTRARAMLEQYQRLVDERSMS